MEDVQVAMDKKISIVDVNRRVVWLNKNVRRGCMVGYTICNGVGCCCRIRSVKYWVCSRATLTCTRDARVRDREGLVSFCDAVSLGTLDVEGRTSHEY